MTKPLPLVLVVLFLAGCDRKPSSSPVSADTPAAAKSTDPGGRVARAVPADTGKATTEQDGPRRKWEFPTENGHAAAGWFYDSWSRWQKAKINDLAAADAKKAFEDDLASVVGKKFRWQFNGTSVNKTGDATVRIPNLWISSPGGVDFPAGGIYVVGVPDGATAEECDRLKDDSGVEVPVTAEAKDIRANVGFYVEATIRKAALETDDHLSPHFILYVTGVRIIL